MALLPAVLGDIKYILGLHVVMVTMKNETGNKPNVIILPYIGYATMSGLNTCYLIMREGSGPKVAPC